MAPATRKNLDRIFREAFEIIQRAQGTKDLAALSQRPQVNRIAVPGGIDLNARNLKMGVGGDKINIKFDPAMIEQFKRGDFSGVRPVIVNITPISSVLPMLGLKEGEYLAAAPVSLPQT